MDLLPRCETALGMSRRNMKGEFAMAEQPKLAEEIQRMQEEEILPVEKKLIGWSIGLGIVLLGFLVWASYTFFPAGH